MHEFAADAGAGEGDSGDGAAVEVDEHAGPAAVILAVLVGTGNVCEVVVHDLDPASILSASRVVRPTAATSGWVKTTWGTAAWSAVAAWAPHAVSSTARRWPGRR